MANGQSTRRVRDSALAAWRFAYAAAGAHGSFKGTRAKHRCARNQVSSAIEDRDFSDVLDLHERLGRDAAPDTVIGQR